MKQKTHAEYYELTQGIHRVFEIIRHDRTQLGGLPHDRTDGFFRRTLLWQLFAETEAQLFQLRILLHITHEAQLHEFNKAEVAVLYEQTYYVDNKGEARERRLTLKTTENIQFVFKTIAIVTGNTEIINRGSAEWELFNTVIKKRESVTHPRKPSDYEINDVEFNQIIEVAKWLDIIFRTGFKQVNEFFFPTTQWYYCPPLYEQDTNRKRNPERAL